MTSGSAAGTARTVIDTQRAAGIRAGLVKIRMYRPFPKERLAQVLKGKQAIGVLDRSIAFGWDCGPMYQEVRSLAAEIGVVPMLSFIDGLANMDITKNNIDRMLGDIHNASLGNEYRQVTWIADGE